LFTRPHRSCYTQSIVQNKLLKTIVLTVKLGEWELRVKISNLWNRSNNQTVNHSNHFVSANTPTIKCILFLKMYVIQMHGTALDLLIEVWYRSTVKKP